MKKCSRCGVEKDERFFNKDNRALKSRSDGLTSRCKQCLKEVRQKFLEDNPDYRADSWRKSRYGISGEEYRRLLAKQANKCAICESSDPGWTRKRFAVDHSHATGEVRGLLCQACNAGLGHFKDDPVVMKKAIRYIRERERNG